MRLQPPLASCLTVLVLCMATSFTAGCAGTPSSGRLYQWGTVKSVLHDGKTEARIDLIELTQHPHCYAVGSLAGLDGEVIVIDGAPWVTRTDGVTGITTRALPEHKEAATLLTAAYVHDWSAIPVDHGLSLHDLERQLAGIAREYGWNPSRGFPFLVEGLFGEVSYHVIRGSCPAQAVRSDDPTAEPFRATVQRERGMLVGFYVVDAGGRITHHGQTVHIHVFFPGRQPAAGHVDGVQVAAGALIHVPAR